MSTSTLIGDPEPDAVVGVRVVAVGDSGVGAFWLREGQTSLTHPFLDGNKPTAVAAADVHLRMNGFELAGDSMEHYQFLVGLMEGGDLDWRASDAWLRDNVEES